MPDAQQSGSTSSRQLARKKLFTQIIQDTPEGLEPKLMQFSKRPIDLVIALLLTPPACVAIGIAALALLIRERTTPFFKQTRVGRNERPFVMVKLRTMHPTTAQTGTHELSTDAVTATGRVLRKYKIDELPQILNVLLGQMSFVGPRPSLPTQVELIMKRRAKGVYAVRPGITGLGQVRGIDMSQPSKLAELDAQYVADWSPFADLRILWQTLSGHGFGDRISSRKSKD